MNDLEQKYISRHMKVVSKLAKLQRLIEDYPADKPSWPLVGNLGYIESELDNLLRFELGLDEDQEIPR